MPERNYIFYRDFDYSGVRYELQIILAHADPLSGTPELVEIPSDVFEEQSIGGNSSWSDRFIGFCLTPELDVGMDIHAIRGSAALDALRRGIAAPFAADAGVIDRGDSTRTVETANVWRIFTNNGTDLAATTLLFEGVQRRAPVENYKVRKGVSTMVTVKLFHIARACLEVLKAEDIYENTKYIDNGVGPFPYLFETIYIAGGVTYAVARLAPGQKTILFRLSELYRSIQDMMVQAYNAFLRRTPGDLGAAFVTLSTGFEVYQAATPFDWLTLYKQSLTAVSVAGDALEPEERYYPGLIVNADDETEELGGMLKDTGSELSLFHWKTLWDFLEESTKGAGSKGTIRQTTAGALELYFAAPRERQTTLMPLDTTLVAEGVEIDKGLGSIAGATADLPLVGSGDDTDEIPAPSDVLSMADDDQEITTTFHNLPLAGEYDNVSQTTFAVISGNQTSATVPGINSFQLYYIDTPSTFSGPVAIRIHGRVDTRQRGPTETGETPTGTGSSYPTPGHGLNANDFKNLFWLPLRLAWLGEQFTMGIPYAVASTARSIWGGDVSRVKATIPVQLAHPNQLGNQIDPSDVLDCSAFQLEPNGDPSDYLASIAGRFWVLGIDYSLDAGTASLSLQVIPT